MKYPFVSNVINCSASKRTGNGCDADSGWWVPSASTASCGVTHLIHNRISQDVGAVGKFPSPSTTDVFKLSVSGVWVPDSTGVMIPGERRSVPIGKGLAVPSELADSEINDDKWDEFSDTRWDGRTGSMIWQTSSNGDGVDTMQPRHVRHATRIFGSAITQKLQYYYFHDANIHIYVPPCHNFSGRNVQRLLRTPLVFLAAREIILKASEPLLWLRSETNWRHVII